MSDPFQSSRRKVARAKKHIADLEREIGDFVKKASYVRFSEPHTAKPLLTVHKIRMNKPIPDGLSEIAGDAIGNLREALDHATFSVAIASGVTAPSNAYFPFSGTVDDIDNCMKKRCKDIPKEMHPFLRAFEPYAGGNEVLFTLNKMANRDKHALLVAFGALSIDAGMNVSGTGGYMSIPRPHAWDHAKSEMELITLGPGCQLNAQFRFLITIAFTGIEVVERFPAPSVLVEITHEVERVLSAIEAESRRLGLVS
jgi:hypothetical protein